MKLGVSQCPLDKLQIIDKACGTSSLEPGILTHVARTLVEASIRAGMSQASLCRHSRGARDQESAVPSRGRPGKMPGPVLAEHSAWGLGSSSSCCPVSSFASDLSESASRARARLLHPASSPSVAYSCGEPAQVFLSKLHSFLMPWPEPSASRDRPM